MEKNHINTGQNDCADSIPQLISRTLLLKKLGISNRGFFNMKEKIEAVIPPIHIGERSTRYRLSDVIHFIERGGFNDYD